MLNFVIGYKDILLVHIIVTLGSSRGRVCPELLPELSVVLTECLEEEIENVTKIKHMKPYSLLFPRREKWMVRCCCSMPSKPCSSVVDVKKVVLCYAVRLMQYAVGHGVTLRAFYAARWLCWRDIRQYKGFITLTREFTAVSYGPKT